MPTKPPFDPKIHLLNPDKIQSDRSGSSSSHESGPSSEPRKTERCPSNELRKTERKKESRKSDRKKEKESRRSNRRYSNEADDAALARRIQEQILEEEMRAEEKVDDMELAQRLQLQENSPDARIYLEDRQNDTGITDPLEYAKSLQQQALRDVETSHTPREPRRHDSTKSSSSRKSGSSSRSSKSGRSHRSSSGRSRTSPTRDVEDPDLALARRMQEREQMGMGSIPDEAGSRTETTLSQEEEDAALARLMAESGDSLRNIDRRNIPLEPPSRASRPGAQYVAYPAGMPRELAGNPVTATLIDSEHRPGKTPTIAAVPGRKSRKKSGATPSSSYHASTSPPVYQPEDLPAPSSAGIPSSMLGMDGINPEASTGRTRRGGRLGFGRKNKVITAAAVPAPIPPMSRILSPEPSKPRVPIIIRPPSSSTPGPVPYSVQGSRLVPIPIERNAAVQKKKVMALPTKKPPICAACKKPASNYVVALDKKFHNECFRCVGCNKLIDSTGPFAFTENDAGDKNPLHKECFSELYGVKCAVCRNAIPPGPDGKVSFVKHPFFDTEQMCPSHAANPGRRCTACHRFEPEDAPFADLGDLGRIVCYSCCRTVVVDSSDAEPLWDDVIDFFDNKLELPVWPDMRDVPILVVGYKALNDQMKQAGCAHVGSSATMTRGVCLTEHQSGRKVPLAALKYNRAKQSFEKCDDAHENGFTFFQVPDAHKVNPDSSVTCILCLSGLPKELTASVLAHEATHAWIKLHPRYDHDNPLPPQVEEGCAQLIALLFLTDGLPPPSEEEGDDGGPSQEKLREYFKYSIETDKNEIYGEGYRKAAEAYSAIGIEALMAHVVLYKKFPTI